MKYALILALFLFGCKGNDDGPCYKDLDKCQTVSENINNLSEACSHLGQCMEGKYNLVHFNNQPHAPWACEVRVDKRRAMYFYPKFEVTFGRIWFDNMANEIAVCDLMKHQGEYSDKRLNELDALFDRMDKERKEREEAKKNPPKGPKLLKIEER